MVKICLVMRTASNSCFRVIAFLFAVSAGLTLRAEESSHSVGTALGGSNLSGWVDTSATLPIPEPSTLALAAAGGAALVLVRRGTRRGA
jgi:hypothetical protein